MPTPSSPDPATPGPTPTPPGPEPPTPTPPAKKTFTESDYDQAQLQTIKNSEAIANAAKDPANNAVLIGEGMQETTPDRLLQACKEWRTLSKEALELTNTTSEAVGEGVDAGTRVRRDVEKLRSKARLRITQNPKWTDTQKEALRKRYFINEDIFASEATAGQSVQTIFDHAAEDALPGITATMLTTFQEDLDAFTGKPTAKGSKQSLASAKREGRDNKFAEVMNLRHEIQHSADEGWPWYGDNSEGFRQLFKLPAGRPFTA